MSDLAISIRPIDITEIGLVESLWNALREHHTALAPTLDSPRSREESWARRRAQYETWLAEPGSFVLVAEQAGSPIGYAMVHLRSPRLHGLRASRRGRSRRCRCYRRCADRG